MLNLGQIVSAVQRNCDISDARHAGDMTMCIFLMKMREFYRWENELPFSCALSKDDVGEWLRDREQMWEDLESNPFEPLPLAEGHTDPFDAERANRELVPQGYVYSAGYGRFCKPHFFLGDLLRRTQCNGFTVYVSSCEYARDLEAPPAMLLGKDIFVRQESVRRFLWEKIEEWRFNRRNEAMARALACYQYDADAENALESMTQNETDAMILHELGEGHAETVLGDQWAPMLRSLSRSKAEIIARAVRDLLADCHATLPGLTEIPRPASIHFYFANLTGMRRHLFPEALRAYADWLDNGNMNALRRFASASKDRWLATAQEMLSLYAQHGDEADKAIESLVTSKAA